MGNEGNAKETKGLSFVRIWALPCSFCVYD
jgi:hypothetical protein